MMKLLIFLPEFKYITCGSVLKLVNPKHNVRLHSHEVKYGSGSGQQVGLSVRSASVGANVMISLLENILSMFCCDVPLLILWQNVWKDSR